MARDARRLAAPIESRLDAPLEPHRPLDPLDPPGELDPREQATVLEGQRLGDAGDPVAGAVGGLEHVRPPEIAARGLVLPDRRQGEAAAAIGVEDRGKGGRRVKARQ